MSLLHSSTFEYLQPSEKQKALMDAARSATSTYATAIDTLLPDGPDKTYVMRKLRELSMWVNVSITRLPDDSPRVEEEVPAEQSAKPQV